MIIDLISDLHGHYPELEGGDLLIVAGDVTNNDWGCPFSLWIEEQKYEKIIWIAGNHDNIWHKSWLEHGEKRRPKMKEGKWKGPERNDKIEYLCDNGTIFNGLKVWGSPWTKSFTGMNQKCKAFTVDTEKELADKWSLIPDHTDILITHSPPFGIMDKVERYAEGRIENCGSRSLLKRARSLPNLKVFVFGHIHEGYGMMTPERILATANKEPERIPTCASLPYIVNASHVDKNYKPVNKPIRIEL